MIAIVQAYRAGILSSPHYLKKVITGAHLGLPRFTWLQPAWLTLLNIGFGHRWMTLWRSQQNNYNGFLALDLRTRR